MARLSWTLQNFLAHKYTCCLFTVSHCSCCNGEFIVRQFYYTFSFQEHRIAKLTLQHCLKLAPVCVALDLLHMASWSHTHIVLIFTPLMWHHIKPVSILHTVWCDCISNKQHVLCKLQLYNTGSHQGQSLTKLYSHGS